jgi:hypothetical protein
MFIYFKRWACFSYDWISGVKVHCLQTTYAGVSKIFRTDAVKITKLTIRPIGRRHPRSSFLPHVDISSTSNFGTVPVSPLPSECQAVCDSSWISSLVSNRRPFSYSFIFRNTRKGSHGANPGEYGGSGMTAICISPETAGWEGALSLWSSYVCSGQCSGLRLRTFCHSRRKTS